MNFLEFVLAIVIVATIGRAVQAYLRRDTVLLPGSGDPQESARLRQEVQFLKERIAVLERLATEDTGAKALDRQIEALRDQK